MSFACIVIVVDPTSQRPCRLRNAGNPAVPRVAHPDPLVMAHPAVAWCAMAKPWVIGLASFLGGGIVASGAWTAFPPKTTTPMKAEPTSSSTTSSDESPLEKANQNLTNQLHECDRRLALLGEKPVGTVPSGTAANDDRDRGRDGGRSRRFGGEPTKEDWERMAEMGVVRTRVPCIRDKPWTPNERVVNRLGLAPQDTEVLKAAYEASNKRMTEQIRPLCAQVLGSPEAADKVGMSSCVEVIQNAARKTNADEAKAALTRVAESQAGKREAPKGGPPIEQLAQALTNESKTFEKDLAAKLGPEEAKRLANAPELCADRHMLRAGDPDDRVPGGWQR
jgi:hypothetical protein